MQILLLAQDPTSVAQDLAKAESVQQVLAIVVGVLLLALLSVVIQYVRRERYHEDETKDAVKAAQVREDEIRKVYEEKLKSERDEQKAIMEELLAALRGAEE